MEWEYQVWVFIHMNYLSFMEQKKIIRLGSCGSYSKDINLLDIILVDKSYTESNFSYTLNNEHVNLAESSKNLTDLVENVAKRENINIVRGNVCSSDCFYMTDLSKFLERLPKDLNIIAVEMESFALFYIAKLLNKEAACLLTVVDSYATKEELTAEQRQNSIDKMTILALESIL